MGSMEIFGLTADALEYLGAGIILVSFIGGAARALGHYLQKRDNVYDLLKFTIGRGLLLGLEFLVAADIVRTGEDDLGRSFRAGRRCGPRPGGAWWR